ncbi:tetratricopeptide repeat protein [Shewanella alkalitolerans]|uniref:tetratricopeptide repeat protein n=1 Tax=Shewanella alkalitolerans TaxID=2864209 RepID=UPI001C65E1D0|nr:tetratricopeptide repeat protein [Shewanella alkalitolerans]QYJ98275.1 tetratricopeptide repeat protein [Shewanella alkalitolerans]
MGKLIRLSLFVAVTALLGACSSTPQKPEHQGNEQIMAIQSQAEHAYKLAMLDQAESLYLEVLKSVPNYAPAWFRLGNIYTRTNRHEAAIAAYRRCIELEPNNQKAWYNMGLVRIKQSTNALNTASNQGDADSAVGRQIKALLDALNQLQSQPQTTAQAGL